MLLINSLISFVRVRVKRRLWAFESSYKKKTYQEWFFKLKPGGSATQYFYHSPGVAQFPFRWPSIVTLSPRVVINDVSDEEKSHVEILERLSSDIITLKWEGIGCIDLICYSKDPAILQKCFSKFLAYCLFFMFLNPANIGNLIYFSLQILIWRKLETKLTTNKTLPVSIQLQFVPSERKLRV